MRIGLSHGDPYTLRRTGADLDPCGSCGPGKGLSGRGEREPDEVGSGWQDRKSQIPESRSQFFACRGHCAQTFTQFALTAQRENRGLLREARHSERYRRLADGGYDLPWPGCVSDPQAGQPIGFGECSEYHGVAVLAQHVRNTRRVCQARSNSTYASSRTVTT